MQHKPTLPYLTRVQAHVVVVAAALLVALLYAGCGSSRPPDASGRQIVATPTQEYTVTQQTVAPRAATRIAGSQPHETPTAQGSAASHGGQVTPVPVAPVETPTHEVEEREVIATHPPPPPYGGAFSIDAQIVGADTIVRARLSSTTAAVETLWAEARSHGLNYTAVLEFRFQVLEYLKGSGANELVALGLEWRAYETMEEATAALAPLLASHDTRWDDRDAIIFLSDEYKHVPSTNQKGRYHLSWLNAENEDTYTVASQLGKPWLPKATTATSSASASFSGEQRFLLDAPENNGKYSATMQNEAYTASASTTPPTITLSALKARIAQLKKEVEAGDGSEDYRSCIGEKYIAEMEIRWLIANEGSATDRYDYYIDSGLPAGSIAYEDRFGTGFPPDKTGKYWLEGKDSHLFSVGTYDPYPFSRADDGVNDRINYTRRVTTTRPLPAGEYLYHFNSMWAGRVVCGAYSELERNLDHSYTHVTAPANTLHEAFFDPIYATSTGEYKADASLGTLKPAGYRKAGDTATTTIHAIAWKAQQATLTTSPGALPADHHVDFIDLDGSVSLRLDVDAATTTTSGGKHTLSWRICRQPWHAGDKLMLRISQSGANLSGATNDAACTAPNPKPTPIATTTPPVATTTPIITSTPAPTPSR